MRRQIGMREIDTGLRQQDLPFSSPRDGTLEALASDTIQGPTAGESAERCEYILPHPQASDSPLLTLWYPVTHSAVYS